MLGFHGLRHIQRRLAHSPLPHRTTTSSLLRTITPAAITTSLSLQQQHHQRTLMTTSGTPTMASEVQEQLQQLQLRDGDVEGTAAAAAAVAGGSVDSSGPTSASGRPVCPRRILMPIAVAPMVDVTTSVSHPLALTAHNH